MAGLSQDMTASQVGREGAIQSALKKQTNELQNLLNAVEELSSRLYPIMTPKPENPKTTEGLEPAGPDKDVDAFILDGIQARNRAIRNITSMVRRLYEQVDL